LIISNAIDMSKIIPPALKSWFVVHCITDLVFALPLFFMPEQFLAFLGWPHFDPMTARLVAAALFGIGLESYFGRNAGREKYLGMLRLKRIWSGFAFLGIVFTMLQMETPAVIGWLLAGVFGGFHLLWTYWHTRLLKIID
jgi:hypothetical protein